MTSPSGPSAVGDEDLVAPVSQPAAGSGPDSSLDSSQDSSQDKPHDRGPVWALVLPPLVALGLSLWGITTPSFWRDEAATIAADRRSFGELLKMLGNVDAVHGAYYIFMWPLVHLFGPG